MTSFAFLFANAAVFNTTVDIRLKQWAEDQLPVKSVQVGWEVLKEKFEEFLTKAKASKNHDSIFDHLKESVVEEAVRRHVWEVKVNILLVYECGLQHFLLVLNPRLLKFCESFSLTH